MTLLLVQALNGLQLGLLLFLIASGLTVVFGVMDVVNLAHGVQYMLGAYLGVTCIAFIGNWWLGALAATLLAGAVGLVLERCVFRYLYGRDHLEQVLATFGLLLAVNEAVRVVWGTAPLQMPMPALLSGSLPLIGAMRVPVYRLALIAAALAVAGALALAIGRTRAGMLVRAGATHPWMLRALGVDVRRLFASVFGVGAMLAGFAGVLAAPLVSVEPGMGDNLLILAFVVIVIGGVGAMHGAFVASLLVGLTDTLGRSFATDAARALLSATAAARVGPAVASMLIYVVMAAVLAVRPAGLFPARA
ncbi:MAG: branched-chain amino acid ABC transporter permease [Acidisphaera sp.]|nr:branched-chain amino acid ABC transporter permease [Acidisphaera sp.]MBV9811789.1 branched-chain amino acid ABC transporter permease [Acetobacteraceae bacterium]